MVNGIVGQKKGMTQVFAEDGRAVPVTVIATPSCKIAQIRTVEKDGYSAVQVAAVETTEKRIGKPRAGHLKKAGLPPMRRLLEFRTDDINGHEVGGELAVGEMFSEGDRVDVRGVSKGRGFAGTIKRHNFAMGDVTHGGMCVRRPGAIGQCADPARVFKGKKMAGQMGNRNVIVRNLEIVRVDVENGYVLVKGAVPGPINGELVVRKTKKGVRSPKVAKG